MFCTFSARAGLKYTKSVDSFDPATFDFKMEGILLTNYGNGDMLLLKLCQDRPAVIS